LRQAANAEGLNLQVIKLDVLNEVDRVHAHRCSGRCRRQAGLRRARIGGLECCRLGDLARPPYGRLDRD
jgi:hypothetical protein